MQPQMNHVVVGKISAMERLLRGQYDNPGSATCRTDTVAKQSEARVATNPERRHCTGHARTAATCSPFADATSRSQNLTPVRRLADADPVRALVIDGRLALLGERPSYQYPRAGLSEHATFGLARSSEQARALTAIAAK